jgi:hypothetical protein
VRRLENLCARRAVLFGNSFGFLLRDDCGLGEKYACFSGNIDFCYEKSMCCPSRRIENHCTAMTYRMRTRYIESQKSKIAERHANLQLAPKK